MAQGLTANGLPCHQYQKNRASYHHIIWKGHEGLQIPKLSKEPTKKAFYKSSEILNRRPFADRNGKLHRSNPHLHFGGMGLSVHHDSRPLGVPPPLPQKSFFAAGKWKSELSNAANLLPTPKKWYNLVFRRNQENKLYRSESFRFIQKTTTILPPSNKPRENVKQPQLRPKKVQLVQIPVCEEYIDPLDQVVNRPQRDQRWSNHNPSTPRSRAECSSRLEDQDVTIPSQNEIIEHYNAPYYYADTIKEPTYCSPCPTLSQNQDQNQPESINSQLPEGPANHNHPCNHFSEPKAVVAGKGNCPESPSAEGPKVPMARKRYETAFLPTSSQHPTSSSPDVDCLILAIESCCSVVEDSKGKNNNAQLGHRVEAASAEQDPSISLGQAMNQTQGRSTPNPLQYTGTGSSTTNSSPFSDKKSKPIMPLSEPLPQKKYSSNSNDSGHSSCSSSSPSASMSFSSYRPTDKRLLLTMMKDNSVSSLESIDSTKSDDFHAFTRPSHRTGSHYSHFGRGGTNNKILSPISDKSPLEPSAMAQTSSSGNVAMTGVHNEPPGNQHQYEHAYAWPERQIVNVSAAELVNVPWDMPKIRRRLALRADSGISLDCSGQPSDSGQFSSSKERGGCCDESNSQQYTRSGSHIPQGQGPDSKNCGSDGMISRGESSNSSGRSRHNLQLNFDIGITQDEYYEDPRLDPSGQEKLPWATSITSVHVHAPLDPEQPPPRPDRCRMRLDFGRAANIPLNRYEINPNVELEAQDWFHGAITRSEAEGILRATKEGSFLVRNCESSSYNRFSLSLKSARGFIHIRIEPNSLGTFSLGEHEFPSVPHLVLHFMYHRLPIKGAEHVRLMYPVITQLL